jgi:hypothetical protein
VRCFIDTITYFDRFSLNHREHRVHRELIFTFLSVLSVSSVVKYYISIIREMSTKASDSGSGTENEKKG